MLLLLLHCLLSIFYCSSHICLLHGRRSSGMELSSTRTVTAWTEIRHVQSAPEDILVFQWLQHIVHIDNLLFLCAIQINFIHLSMYLSITGVEWSDVWWCVIKKLQCTVLDYCITRIFRVPFISWISRPWLFHENSRSRVFLNYITNTTQHAKTPKLRVQK